MLQPLPIAQPDTHPRAEQDLRAAAEIVRRSYGRCQVSGAFLTDFYTRLVERLPQVGPMFAPMADDKRQAMIQQGVLFLVMYARGHSVAKSRIAELGASHGSRGHGVRANYYRVWLDVLVELVAERDPEFDDHVRAAWRQVTAPGIAAMQAGAGGSMGCPVAH